jgi:hypothetical protein
MEFYSNLALSGSKTSHCAIESGGGSRDYRHFS